MRKNSGVLSRFNARMGLNAKADKIWFWATFSLLVVYGEAVVFLQDYNVDRVALARSVLSAVCVVPVCFGGVLLCRRIRLTTGETPPDKRRSAVVFVSVAALAFAYYFLWQWTYWPGSFSVDSFDQLGQVISGQYSNWHPVLQTWLFFTLPYKLFHSAGAIVTMQLLWFSLAFSYLITTLYKNSCSKWFIVLGGLYILVSPCTIQIMLYPWKDSAMSLFALVLFTQLIQIYATDGQWLKKWYNLAAFTLFAFLTNAMRHNAILLVAPVFVVLLVFLKNARRPVWISAAGFLAATLILQGPIFSLANVEKPDQRVVETMGLPMTILCNVYANDPEALSPEIQQFMASLATPFDWAFYHETGNFNPIKWYSSKGLPEKVDAMGHETLFRYTAQAFRNSPRYAFQALVRLTSMVWSVGGGPGWTIASRINANDLGIARVESRPLRWLLDAYNYLATSLPAGYLFNFTGLTILILLFAAVSRVGGGLGRAFLVLAPLAYDFGTMLLLSGPDFRFFHCNFVLIVPLLYLFLRKERTEEDEA